MRSLCTLLGGTGWFVSCRIWTNHFGLPLGQGRLPRWPLFMSFLSSSGTVLDLLLHFWVALCLYGALLLGFASKVPTWRLPPSGGVADLVTEWW